MLTLKNVKKVYIYGGNRIENTHISNHYSLQHFLKIFLKDWTQLVCKCVLVLMLMVMRNYYDKKLLGIQSKGCL